MNEITNIINEYSFPNNEKLQYIELHTTKDQMDSSFKSLHISMIQLRQILNILNSQFYNSSISVPDASQTPIKLYYELYQTIVKCFKPVEIAIQNPNTSLATSNSKFETLYFKFITNFIELLLAIDLPKELFISISTFFSPLLVIFMRNLTDEKTNISFEDFSLLAQLNQGSFAVFESIIKRLYINCFDKLDLLSNLILSDNDVTNKSNETLKSCIEELRKSFVSKKKNSEQYQTILNSILSIRCELISHRNNKFKVSSLLNEIESNANIGSLFSQAQQSSNEFIDFLNQQNQDKNVSIYFTNINDIQSFYEKVNKFQLFELEKLYEDDLVQSDFYEEMKTILSNIFDYRNNSDLFRITNLVDIQLISHHRKHSANEEQEKQQQEKSFDQIKNEGYDLFLSKNDPPENYDKLIDTFLDFIRNIEIAGDTIPLTLEKDTMVLQFADIVSSFKRDKLNRPIKSEIDHINFVFNELSLLVDKIITVGSSSNNDDNNKSSMFLLTYINTINILLIAKEKYQNSNEQFEPIIQAFRDLIPPPIMIRKMLNIEERYQELQKASNSLIESTSHFTQNSEVEGDQVNDQQLNDAAFIGSNAVSVKLMVELELASLILSFVEKNENFVNEIGCSEFSNNIWPQKTIDENDENKEIYFDENGFNASLTLLSLFKIEGFNFDYSPNFFINWIIFNFSTINMRIQSSELVDFVPFCDYSDLSGKIINSCTLIELYARINSSDEMISNVESMKLSTFAFFTALSTSVKLEEIQLTKQIQACIKYLCGTTSLHKKINVLCHTVLTKIYSFAQLFEFLRYARILSPSKVNSLIPIDIYNYSIEILNKLRLVAKCELLAPDFRESIDEVASKITQIIADPENNARPLFFSQGNDQSLIQIFSTLNQVRKIVEKFDIMAIATQVSNYIDAILSFYESQQDEDHEGSKHVFSPDVFNLIKALMNQVNEFMLATKPINAQILAMNLQLILEKAEKIVPRMEKPLQELNEMINISYAIYSIKTILNFAYFTMSQFAKNGFTFENWFEGEFNENSIYKEDETINTMFKTLLEYINNIVTTVGDLQSRINNIMIENNYNEVDHDAINNNQQLKETMNMIGEIDSNFQSFVNDLKSRISKLNDRKIHPDVPRLESECEELINQYMSYPNQPPSLVNIYRKFQVRTPPSSNQLITQFESECLQLSLKNITIKEMEKKIVILKDELNKKQIQINQNIDSSIINTKKKQRERSDQIIKLIKEAISDNNNNNNDKQNIQTTNISDSNNNNNNKDEILPNDPNYETCQRLRKQLSAINQENLQLRDEIRELERHHMISREDQIELLMNKSVNFPNPNAQKEFDEEKSGSSDNNKKDDDALDRRVNELSESIKKMKRKIQVDKKQGSNEASIIKLFKDIRPRGFPETLINEDIYKQFTKSTRERADSIMKQWRMLRADLALYDQNS